MRVFRKLDLFFFTVALFVKYRLCGATVNEKRVMKRALAPSGAENPRLHTHLELPLSKGKTIVICSVEVSAVKFLELRKQRA